MSSSPRCRDLSAPPDELRTPRWDRTPSEHTPGSRTSQPEYGGPFESLDERGTARWNTTPSECTPGSGLSASPPSPPITTSNKSGPARTSNSTSKRKLPVEIATPPPKAPKVNHHATGGPTKAASRHIFPFFELPTELQDQIYDTCARDATKIRILTKPTKGDPKGGVTCCHPLTRVCQTTRDEIHLRLDIAAPVVIAHVTDFDLTAVKAYVKQLEKTGRISGFYTLTGTRKIVLNLRISASWCKHPDFTALWHNCDWLIDNTRHTHKLNIKYRTTHAESLEAAKWPMAQITSGDAARQIIWNQIAASFHKYVWVVNAGQIVASIAGAVKNLEELMREEGRNVGRSNWYRQLEQSMLYQREAMMQERKKTEAQMLWWAATE